MASRILSKFRGSESKSVNENSSNHVTATKDPLEKHIVPIHKELSEAGQFSLAALCATLLHALYISSDSKFKDEALDQILNATEQCQQVCDSVRAILQGYVPVSEVDPYIDILLAEDYLKEGAEPVISYLIAVAVGQAGCYDARMRVLIKEVAWRLKVDQDTMIDIETSMAEALAFSQYEMSDEEKLEKVKKSKRRKYKRYALIALATVGGGTLIGLTGGLAAPLVAAGAGAVIGGAGAAVLGSTAGVAIIGSLFGVAGAGLTGYKMKKRVGAIEEFRFEPLVGGSALRACTLTKQFHITIVVTGWLNNDHRDFKEPWENLSESKEQYTLCWESKYLVQLGDALNYILNSAMTVATKEALKFTVLRGLLAAITWPSALISAASVIDNPWSVALQRAQEAGKMLAEVLLAREQGRRPVTLIGFSLGARVLFSCLEEMSKRKGNEGIVEDVILLGAPAPGDPKIWETFSQVVSGKIVNGYCRGDWLLKFLYRASSVQLRIAGVCPVKWSDRRMHNIDLSDVVSGHFDYKQQLSTIMAAVRVQTREHIDHSSTTNSSTADSIRMNDLSSSNNEISIEEPEFCPATLKDNERSQSASCLPNQKLTKKLE